MKRLRFTIAGLLGLVLFFGIAFAALKAASPLWASALLSAIACLLLVGVLIAFHRTGRPRAFWAGFTLWATVYLVAGMALDLEPPLLTTRGLRSILAHTPTDPSGNGIGYFDYDSDGSVDIFITNSVNGGRLYRNLGDGAFADVTDSSNAGQVYRNVGNGAFTGVPDAALPANKAGANGLRTRLSLYLPRVTGDPDSFLRIGHMLFALVFGFVGGRISVWLSVHGAGRQLV
jgi:hypothetical protein